MASLVAASALLIDYNLTAAVSTSSAVEQIVSAFPALDRRSGRPSASSALVLITIGNLRGIREAGNIFAVPTYLFLFSALADDRHRRLPDHRPRREHGRLAEVVAATVNATAGRDDLPAPAGVRRRRRRPDRHRGDRDRRPGVPAARGEERGQDPAAMAGVLAILFIGITFLARRTSRIIPRRPEKQTVIAQVAATVFGNSILFFLFQAFTALLLFLAANTSFAAFPRLAAVLAEDGFFPRQFAFRGDRLAFSMGIVLPGLDRRLAGHRRRRPDPRADPAVRGRRVHRLHDQPGRA